ncbi:MAG: bifunctional glutamate N-acetyltransferase/amino-acid acetyltransferase ArgJ, partial [Alphaproteobacteria bacterium]|nr:bifunctional glutamate N-acetyltransferase/amino-acid acetyltransferase ArgJ [Alphaproteobacteria bacterium]
MGQDSKKSTSRSPLAPARFPAMPAVAGVGLATACSGSRYKGRDDLLLATFAPGTSVAGVFTQSQTPGAPVTWTRDAVRHGGARGLLVNAGNANAFTGSHGDAACETLAREMAHHLEADPRDVSLASTGVIGEPLDVVPITQKLAQMVEGAHQTPGQMAWEKAAAAIMTTDTFAKGATRTAEIDGTKITINGIAKGSGMIAPDMATMLSFVMTDAAIPPNVLENMLLASTRDSFNAITVDGDTSTSDMCLMYATSQARHEPVRRASDPRLKDFREKLDDLMQDLARQVVCDGEGATKFITITVTGAASAHAARRIAMSIANSPLVKTAIAGEDANWGRVVMAVGKSGEQADRDKLMIAFGGYRVAQQGMRDPDYDETVMSRYMQGQHIDIEVD